MTTPAINGPAVTWAPTADDKLIEEIEAFKKLDPDAQWEKFKALWEMVSQEDAPVLMPLIQLHECLSSSDQIKALHLDSAMFHCKFQDALKVHRAMIKNRDVFSKFKCAIIIPNVGPFCGNLADLIYDRSDNKEESKK